MSLTTITTRAMTTSDVPRVVQIHFSAFPGFFLTFLGPRFLQLFYAEAVALDEIALVACAGNLVTGFVMGSARAGSFFQSLLRRRALAFAIASVPALLRRPSGALRLVRALAKPKDATKKEGTATLMSLGVAHEIQGMGVGKALVKSFFQEAARRGASKVDLTTDKMRNEGTNAFYVALGFQVARELVTPEQRILNEYEIDLHAY